MADRKNNENRMRLFIKRIIDIAVSLTGLVLLGPALLILALVVRLKLGSPVIFCQKRPGLEGRPFMIYKFRTMTDKCDSNGKLLSDHQRLPPFGHFLRGTSLDELPELWNVLKGDMSLVGPRPLMMAYLDRYSPQQARRHEVKPGVTGWAQINGRNNISWEEKFDMDVWYVDNWNLRLDFVIIFRTLLAVVKRHDVNQEGRATVDEFMGTKLDSNDDLSNGGLIS